MLLTFVGTIIWGLLRAYRTSEKLDCFWGKQLIISIVKNKYNLKYKDSSLLKEMKINYSFNLLEMVILNSILSTISELFLV